MKQHLLCNILKISIHLSFIVAIVFIIGCGEKENRDIVEARAAIVRGDYAAAQAAVQKTDTGNQEARHLKAFLQNRTRPEAESWAPSDCAIQRLSRNVGGRPPHYFLDGRSGF